MISKDLLSKILVLNIVCVSNFLRKDNMLEYQFLSSKNKEYGYNNLVDEIIYPPRQINIYELAYKCKEWALRKNYILASESNTYGGICNMSISSIDVDVFYNIQSTTRANTEVEAVIKACEWILNNKDRK